MSNFEEKQMPNFEELVNKCTEDTKKSGIEFWRDEREIETKVACSRMLSSYILARTIENKYPKLFKLASKEVF